MSNVTINEVVRRVEIKPRRNTVEVAARHNLTMTGDKTYRHIQVTPASTWNVSHGLGKHPAVTVVDSGGDIVLANVIYVDLNTVQLLFSAGFAGEAYFN